jgi:putative ABC transport system permease protein
LTPFRFALREIRHRPIHAALFILSVALGSGVLLGLAGFAAAVENGVRQQARELWAADVTVEGTPGFLDALEPWARDRWPGLRVARGVDAVSMVRAGDRVGQVTLSGVTDGYPLHGEIRTGSGRALSERLRDGLVVAPKVLDQWGIAVGDPLLINGIPVPVVDTLAARTDAPASFFEFAPTVLLDLARLRATGLLAPGSRSLNRLYLNVPPGVPVEDLYRATRERAAPEAAEVRTWTADNPGVFRFIQNTLTYLGFLALLTLTLGGIGVASALQSALGAAMKSTGMMLALGAPRVFLFRVWGVWGGLLLAVGLAGGLALGRGVSVLLTTLYGDMIPVNVTLGFPGGALLQAALVAGVSTALFTALPLARLFDVSPNAVLSWDPPAFAPRPRRALLFVLAAAPVFVLLVWAQTGRFVLSLAYVAALASLGALATGFVRGFLSLLRRVRAPASLTARLALRGLARRSAFQTAAAVALGLAFAAVLALGLIQKNLTDQLVKSFPDNMPNVFFINIQKEQQDAFRAALKAPVRLFPLVRGRVAAVNGKPVAVLAERRGGEGDRLTREFGLTFGEDLLPTDTVVRGQGLWDDRVEGPQVSGFIEHHERFGLNVGDRIEFSVLGRRITATLVSLRAIDQTVRQPFFYFYFRPGAIDAAPHTYMGGVHLPPERIVPLQRALARALPNVTAVDVTEVTRLTGRVLGRLARVVNAVGVFAFGAGLLLLVSSLLAALPERRRDAVLYRTLGATGPRVAAVFFVEFLGRGAAAAATALVAGTLAAGGLVHGVMDLPFRVPWTAAIAGLAAATVFLGLFSLIVSLPALRTPPMEVLRYE